MKEPLSEHSSLVKVGPVLSEIFIRMILCKEPEKKAQDNDHMHSSGGRWGRCATQLRKTYRVKLLKTAKQLPVPHKSSSSKKIQIW